MSSQSSFVTVPATNQGLAQSIPGYSMQVVGSPFRATPTAVNDTEAQGFLIDAYGRLIPTGAAADNAAKVGNPILTGAVYNLAAQTYDDGDVADLQVTAAGHLRTFDATLDGQMTTLNAHMVTLEAYVDQLEGYTDGLETLIGTTNTSLAAIEGYTDQLEGFVDGLETLATSLNGYVDGLETLIGTTNTSLSAIEGYVDGLETVLSTMDGRLTTIVANTGARLMNSSFYVDYASTNLPGNASLPLQIVASSGAIRLLSIFDTGGAPFELMIGAAAAEVRLMTFGPGADGEFNTNIPINSRVSLRRLDSASALTGGDVCINFLA